MAEQTASPLGMDPSPGLYLGGEVMLLQLPPFPQVPGAHSVVQAPCPQLCTIVGDVYAAGPVRVALELPWEQGKKGWNSGILQC